MSPAATKRNSVGGGPSSKRARNDAADSCSSIAAVLITASSYPEAVLKMLSSGLAPALSTFKEERHGSQAQVVTWVDEVMASIEQQMDAAVVKANAELEAAQAALATKEAAVVEQETALQGLQETSGDSASKLAEAASKLATAEKDLTKAQSAAAKAEKELESLNSKKATVESVITGPFKELLDAAGSKKAITAFINILKKEKAEELLLATAPVTFAQAPESRGDFDKLVATQVEELLKQRVSEVDAKISTANESKAPLDAAVDEAAKAAAAAKESHDALEAQSAEATANVKAAEASLRDAKKERKDASPAVKAAEQELKQATKAADEFKANELASFAALRDRTAPVEEPADSAAPEAAAA